MSKTITLLVGPPGSGKSTHAREYRKAHGDREDLVYVNQDSQGKKGHMEIFLEAIEKGHDVIVDRMGFDKKQRDRYLNPAREAGYETRIIVLHVPMDVCMDRCRKRENHETVKTEEDVQNAVTFFFRNYERVKDNEADQVIRSGWVDSSAEKVLWVDLDGTLCNVEHRRHHVRPPEGFEGKFRKNWRAFFEEMINDTPNQWCVDLLSSMFECGHNFVYATGRGGEYRDLTEKWLTDNNMDFDSGLYTRLARDSRKDYVIKEIILEFEVKTRYNVLFAIDDRKQVVDMLRLHKIVVLHCAEGDF